MATTASSPARPIVIDAHVHAFPDEVIARRDDLVRRDHWFGRLYTSPTARLTTAADLLASMDAAGVDRAVMCGFPWSEPGLCRLNNDWMASEVAASGGRLAWLGIVVPHLPGAAGEADRCLALGASGIGELNADGQGFDLTVPAHLAPLAEVCVAADRPILLHSTEPVGHPYAGKGTATPDRLLSAIAALPDLDFVLAHLGGGLPFYELMPEVARICGRVRYDTAASPYLYRHGVLRVAVEAIGADRIIWGSDFPVLGQERFLARTLATDLPPTDLTAILSGNAARTYRLPPLPDPPHPAPIPQEHPIA